MIKPRWEIWIAIVLLLIGSKVATNLYNENKLIKEKEAQAQIITANLDEFDLYVKDHLNDTYFNVNDSFYQIKAVNTNADFIITEDTLEKSDYIELENYLYSPYILTGYSAHCLKSANEIKENLYSYDLKLLLEAIESELDWDEIEDYDTDYENPAKMTIIADDEELNKIKEYFILTLNNYKDPTEAEYNELSKRVEKIISKCSVTSNPVIDDYYTITFMSEEYFLQNDDCFKTGIFDKGLHVLVPNQTIKNDYNVYIKENKVDLVKNIIQTPTFLDSFGLKNIDYNNLAESVYYSYTLNSYNFVTQTNEIKISTATPSSIKEANETNLEETKTSEEEESIETQNKKKGDNGYFIIICFFIMFILIVLLATA